MPPSRFTVAFFVGALSLSALAEGQYIPIFSGPSYDTDTRQGYSIRKLPFAPAPNGIAVGEFRYSAPGIAEVRGAIWQASDERTTLLPDGMGPTPVPSIATYVRDMNDFATIAGSARLPDLDGSIERAARWDDLGRVVTILPGLPDSTRASSAANAINNAGTMVGYARKVYGGTNGERAVRWDVATNEITELGHLGTNSSGWTSAHATDISETGIIVGWARKFGDHGGAGKRAVLWDAESVEAIELGNLGVSDYGVTDCEAVAINDRGQIIGRAPRYIDGDPRGDRAVVWDLDGNILELGSISINTSDFLHTTAVAINNNGTVVGYERKYLNAESLSDRAVRWDASDGTAFELPFHEQNLPDYARSYADDINDNGYIVGTSNGSAVYWTPDNDVIDLNRFVDPDSGWVKLFRATGISDDGWVTGYGRFDVDGPGGTSSYTRMFLLNIHYVPEPATSVIAAALVLVGTWLRYRWSGARRSAPQ